MRRRAIAKNPADNGLISRSESADLLRSNEMKIIVCLALVILAGASLANAAGDTEKQRKEIAAFFTGPIPTLRLEVSDENVDFLRREPKRYVEGRLRKGAKVWTDVGIKLKGAEGSFRPIDEKPGLTLNFGKFKDAARFHGLKKLHLNNAREDDTYLRQLICGEMARAAGTPANRPHASRGQSVGVCRKCACADMHGLSLFHP